MPVRAAIRRRSGDRRGNERVAERGAGLDEERREHGLVWGGGGEPVECHVEAALERVLGRPGASATVADAWCDNRSQACLSSP